ncbi:molybdopterin-dependent oxidoreductase, partial [Phaeovulum sp.]|uniref:molybdopterin-dependent oxidoreductase n=1 Tax=Phaeovulum sp. TaxID=2934796 RepID=UPI00356493B5
MNSLSHIQMSRRAVLGGFTAIGAGTLFMPSMLRAETTGMSMMNGEVVTGSHWGLFTAKIVDGRFVSTTPHANDQVPNTNVEALPDLVYSPTRIKYPMVRKSFLEKGYMSDRTERGKGEFVRVSWDEALDLVAAELKRVKETYGNASIYGGSYGWKSSGVLHNCVSGLQRMLNLNGGFVTAVNTYSTGSIRVIMPYVIGGSFYDSSSWVPTIENTELIVFWGSNPATTNRIAGGVPDHANMALLDEFRKTGKPSIVIDPLRTKTADFLGSEWIAPRPGTDVAMMLGVAHTLLSEGLHDQQFLDDYTVGFDEFSAYLMGEEDGVVKTAEWASEICGVDAEVIEGLARTMASKRTLITHGWSIQRAHHGEQGPWMTMTLACMLGYVGLPGGGADFTLHYSSYGTPVGRGPSIPGLSSGQAVGTVASVADPSAEMPAPIPVSRVPWALANPGAQYDYNGKSYNAPDLRLVYWSGGNPMHHHQDRNLHIKYWQSPETIIVQDYNWTQTARFADIVLPATTSYERNDMSPVSDKGAGFTVMKKV